MKLIDCPACGGDGRSKNECDFEFDGFTAVCRVNCEKCDGDGAFEEAANV